jgi:hypothetical protein
MHAAPNRVPSRQFVSFAFFNRSNSTRHNAPNQTRTQSARGRGIRGRFDSKLASRERQQLQKQIPAFGENDGVGRSRGATV